MSKEYELRVYETEQDRDNGEFVLFPFSSCVGLKEAIEESYDYFNNNECVELLESDTEEVILNFSWEQRGGIKQKEFIYYTEESKELLHLLNEDKDKELQEPINLYSSDCKVRY